MPRPDRHNEIELNLLECGSLTYLLGGAKVTVSTGRLAVFWAAIPHQIIGVQDTSNYHVATVPLAWFLQWDLPPRLVEPILHGRMMFEARADEGARDRAIFSRWHQDLARPTQQNRRVVLLEAQARLLRLGLALPSEPATPPLAKLASLESPALSKAEEIAAFLAKHYREPLTSEEVGKAVGLHPNYAMNLFKKVFSTTLTQYLTQHRLSHAQRLLATTNAKILSVAMESGFGSISRFNDAFRKAFGCSPRGYRQEHRV